MTSFAGMEAPPLTLALSPQRVERGFLLWNTKVITSFRNPLSRSGGSAQRVHPTAMWGLPSFRNSDEVGMSGIQEKEMIC